MIYEATVDCYGNDEQLMGFYSVIEDNIKGVHSRGELAPILPGVGRSAVYLHGGGGRGSLRVCPVSLRLMTLRGFVLRMRGSGP